MTKDLEKIRSRRPEARIIRLDHQADENLSHKTIYILTLYASIGDGVRRLKVVEIFPFDHNDRTQNSGPHRGSLAVDTRALMFTK